MIEVKRRIKAKAWILSHCGSFGQGYSEFWDSEQKYSR